MEIRAAEMAAFLENALDRIRREERGLNAGQLLGNLALGVVALLAIWAALRVLGIDIVEVIREGLSS